MPGYTVITTAAYFVESESENEAINKIYETLLGNGDAKDLGNGEIACIFAIQDYQRIIK
jgi:hypothetical protein